MITIIKEFKEFALKGNFLDMAIGILIGAGLAPVVASFVSDIVMPPLGLLLGGTDFSSYILVLKEGTSPAPYLNIDAAKSAGAVFMSYGLFLNKLISFLSISWVAFFVIKIANKFRNNQAPAPDTKDCPSCLSPIPIAAKKCKHCCSEVH